jgi:hypothetical protein
VYGYREHIVAGGVISYCINVKWCFHRSAYYIDKILKGAKPSELPVEFPTRLELVINLKTARALGLDIPLKLHAFADGVIEMNDSDPCASFELEDAIRKALNKPGRTEGVRKIAERFGVNPGTVQRISRPFEASAAA